MVDFICMGLPEQNRELQNEKVLPIAGLELSAFGFWRDHRNRKTTIPYTLSML